MFSSKSTYLTLSLMIIYTTQYLLTDNTTRDKGQAVDRQNRGEARRREVYIVRRRGA